MSRSASSIISCNAVYVTIFRRPFRSRLHRKGGMLLELDSLARLCESSYSKIVRIRYVVVSKSENPFLDLFLFGMNPNARMATFNSLEAIEAEPSLSIDSLFLLTTRIEAAEGNALKTK